MDDRRVGPRRTLPQLLALAIVSLLSFASALAPAQETNSDRKPDPEAKSKATPKSAAKPKPAAKSAARTKSSSKAKPRSSAVGAADLLRPPGSDPYNTIDWTALPPWKQTSFFGIRAKGQVFIYVVDCSGSMADEERLIRAKAEIRRSVMNLRWPQKFLVIFYNDRPLTMPGGVPAGADLNPKLQLADWLRTVGPEGETDPRAAMAMAVALRPDAVFLLSDGEFPPGSVEAIAEKNTRRVPVHCIDLAGGAAGDQLQRIAKESGGQYVSRP